jgi:hypothetical protein
MPTAGSVAAFARADLRWLAQLISRRVPLARWSEALVRLLHIISASPKSESSQASTLVSRFHRGGLRALDEVSRRSSAFRFVSRLAWA